MQLETEAEELMLTTVWVASDKQLLGRLDAKDFADPFCRWLFEVLAATVKAGEPLDMLAVMRRARSPEWLEALPVKPDQLGEQVGKILHRDYTSAHAGYYLSVLRENRLKRAAWALVDQLKNQLKSGAKPEAVLALAVRNGSRLLEAIKEKAN